jgi:transposase InsO family protein
VTHSPHRKTARALPTLDGEEPVIQTDNGVEFGASFHWHVLDKGIGHVYIKPRTPRLNGKAERSHRIDAEEFYRLLEGVVIDDAQVFNDKLARVGRLLQLPSTPRRPGRPDAL